MLDKARSYLGQTFVGTNSSDSGQCVGFFNRVVLDVTNVLYPLQGASGAKDLITCTNTRTDLFEQVQNNPNNPDQLPGVGDWVIWGASWGGGWGHVACVETVDTNGFTAIEQNYAPNKVTRQSHNWGGVIGWVRFISSPVVASNQRVVGAADVNCRQLPTTESAVLRQYENGDILDFKGFTHGQNVSDNDIWFVGAYSGVYCHSGSFKDVSTNGLPDLTQAPATPPPVVAPPVVIPPYTFNKDLDCVTEVIPTANGNFQSGNFPDKPEKAVIHDFGTLGKDTYTGTIAWFSNPASETSAHFVVSGKKITQMVSLKDRAYHAGPNGNNFVGIETDPAQDSDTIQSVRTVLEQLKAKYGYQLALIKHSQIMNTACGDDVDLAKYDITPVVPPVIPEPPVVPENPTTDTPPAVEPPINAPTSNLWDSIMQLFSVIVGWLKSWKR